MSQDYHYTEVAKWENGVPYDKWGHALRHDDTMDGNREARDLTSPYGVLAYACGDSDDFWCFDYGFLPDGRIALHAVINSETGGFIQDGSYQIVSRDKGADVARAMIDEALAWCAENDIKHDSDGWNQEPTKFLDDVYNECREVDSDD